MFRNFALGFLVGAVLGRLVLVPLLGLAKAATAASRALFGGVGSLAAWSMLSEHLPPEVAQLPQAVLTLLA